MTEKDDRARLLVKAADCFNERQKLALAPQLQMEAIRELHSFGVLSIKAMAAIVGCTEYRTESALAGGTRPRARGLLNPKHIPWLGYVLSTRKLAPVTLRQLIQEGTSISTIADLTLISEATLHRWRKNG
jgi:hypothetical protein